MEKVEIRNYRDSDYEDVKKNLEDGELYYFECDSRENLKRKIERDPDSILVAVVDGRAVGSVYIVAEPWCAFIFRLVVRKDYRKTGTSSLLMKEAEKILKEKGIKWVSVFVEDSKEDLKKYYEKRGYVPAKVYRDMDKDLKNI